MTDAALPAIIDGLLTMATKFGLNDETLPKVDDAQARLAAETLLPKAQAEMLIKSFTGEHAREHERLSAAAGELPADSAVGYIRVTSNGGQTAVSSLEGIDPSRVSKLIILLLFPVNVCMMLTSNALRSEQWRWARTISIVAALVAGPAALLARLLGLDFIDVIVWDTASVVRPPFFLLDVHGLYPPWMPIVDHTVKALLGLFATSALVGMTFLAATAPFHKHLVGTLRSAANGFVLSPVARSEAFSDVGKGASAAYSITRTGSGAVANLITCNHPSALLAGPAALMRWFETARAILGKDNACLPLAATALFDSTRQIMTGVTALLATLTATQLAELLLIARGESGALRAFLAEAGVPAILADVLVAHVVQSASMQTIIATRIQAACGGGDEGVQRMLGAAKGSSAVKGCFDPRLPRRTLDLGELLRGALAPWELAEVCAKSMTADVARSLSYRAADVAMAIGAGRLAHNQPAVASAALAQFARLLVASPAAAASGDSRSAVCAVALAAVRAHMAGSIAGGIAYSSAARISILRMK